MSDLSPDTAAVIAGVAERASRAAADRDRLAGLDAAIVDGFPSALIVVDAEWQVVRANRRAVSMFGYSVGELIGQHVEMLMPEEFRTAHPARQLSYAVDPRVRPMGTGAPVFGLSKSGDRFPISVELAIVEPVGGSPCYIAIISPP